LSLYRNITILFQAAIMATILQQIVLYVDNVALQNIYNRRLIGSTLICVYQQ